MPGFGAGPFGNEPFGNWPWSAETLFGLLPGIYQQQDAANGDLLFAFFEGLRPSFDNFLYKIQNWTPLRDPLQVRTAYDETTTIRLGPVRNPTGTIVQRGVDGVINTSRQFRSVSVRFSTADLGRILLISGSSIPTNNRTFTIVSIVNTTTVVCDPPLVPDAGPLKWEEQTVPAIVPGTQTIEIRGGDVSVLTPGWTLSDGSSQFDITARRQFYPGLTKLLTVREGSLGQALNDGTFLADKPFTQQDVGKPLSIHQSAAPINNGKFEILGVNPTNLFNVYLSLPLTIGGFVGNTGDVIYTYVPGHAGVTVVHFVSGPNSALSAIISGSALFVFLASDPNGFPISTAAQVAAAVNALPLVAGVLVATFNGPGAGVAGVSTTPQLIPGTSLAPDPSNLYWALLPFPQIDISATAPPAGIVTQEGVDGTVGVINNKTFSSPSAKFASSVVGQLLVVRGSSLGNDSIYTITGFVNLTTVTIASANFIAESGLTWELRTVSTVGDGTKNIANAPSLLAYLAQDFGITVDTQDTEPRQRSWVKNVTQWIDLKGTEKAYEIIGAISGFNITVSPLYRISSDFFNALPLSSQYLVGPSTTDDVGRLGTDGHLFLSGTVWFEADSALFTPSDIGSQVLIGNSPNVFNNKLYTIAVVHSPTTVSFLTADTAITPDVGIGASIAHPYVLTWSIVRQYTTLPPARPNFDEVNAEMMETIVGVSHFTIDQFCWDPEFINSIPLNILSVTPSVGFGTPITITVEASGVAYDATFTTMQVIGAVGRWSITESSAATTTNSGAITLPSTTLTVASTLGFASSGSIFVTTVADGIQEISYSGISGLTFTGCMGGVGSIVNGQPVWQAGATYWVETLPVEISVGPPAVHTFQIFSAQVPALGPAMLTYNCPITTSCSYCRSNKVLALIEPGSISSETGLAQENVLLRVIARLTAEVTPAHVELVPIYFQGLQATLNLTAAINANHQIFATLIAPETAYYDTIIGDVITPDGPGLSATIVTP